MNFIILPKLIFFTVLSGFPNLNIHRKMIIFQIC